MLDDEMRRRIRESLIRSDSKIDGRLAEFRRLIFTLRPEERQKLQRAVSTIAEMAGIIESFCPIRTQMTWFFPMIDEAGKDVGEYAEANPKEIADHFDAWEDDEKKQADLMPLG